MNREEILRKLENIFRDVFDNEELTITEETEAEDIEDWDSLGQVYLLVGAEEVFGIKFGEEADQIKKVSELVDLIEMCICDNQQGG